MPPREITQDLGPSDGLCPQCKAKIPVHPGFLDWCGQCGWNLEPHVPERSVDVFEQIQESLGQKYGQELLGQLLISETPRPTLTGSTLLALGLAICVHLIPVLLAILGIWLLSRGDLSLLAVFTTPAATLSGLVCLGLAWSLVPRPSKAPTSLASRQRFAALYRLVANTAQALRAPSIDGIVIDENFNASVARLGWRGKRILFLGLPLLSMLDSQEQIALLGHELAHNVNRDPSRILPIYTAIHSLVQWYSILRPRELATGTFGAYGVLLIPLNLLRLGLAELVRLPLFGIGHLLWRDSQRAEYLADYLAASAAGTEAMQSLLEKLCLRRTWDLTVHQVYVRMGNQDLFDAFREQVATVPQRELERIRRIELMQPSRLDINHPPNAYRLEFLRSRPVVQPRVTMSPVDAANLAGELEAIKPATQAAALRRHQERIRYGW